MQGIKKIWPFERFIPGTKGVKPSTKGVKTSTKGLKLSTNGSQVSTSGVQSGSARYRSKDGVNEKGASKEIMSNVVCQILLAVKN